MLFFTVSGAAWALGLVCLGAFFKGYVAGEDPDYLLLALFVTLFVLGGIAFDTGAMAVADHIAEVCAI